MQEQKVFGIILGMKTIKSVCFAGFFAVMLLVNPALSHADEIDDLLAQLAALQAQLAALDGQVTSGGIGGGSAGSGSSEAEKLLAQMAALQGQLVNLDANVERNRAIELLEDIEGNLNEQEKNIAENKISIKHFGNANRLKYN